jgi:hypothetical protein
MFLARECRRDLMRHSRGARDFFLACKIVLDSLARDSDVGLRARSCKRFERAESPPE